MIGRTKDQATKTTLLTFSSQLDPPYMSLVLNRPRLSRLYSMAMSAVEDRYSVLIS